MPLFENLLRLKEEVVSDQVEATLVNLGRSYQMDLAVFQRIWKLLVAEDKCSGQELEDLFASYLEALRQLAVKVDGLEVRS